MKTLLLLLALLVAVPVFAHPHCPPGVVRIYVYEDGDQFADSYGSGAVISPTQILTNYHVVKDRRKNNSVQVRFSDGSRRGAIVIASSEKWDIVLLKIHLTPFTPLKLGERPQAGQNVTIQGFGSDYEYVAAAGTVSHQFFFPTEGDPGDFFQVRGATARQGDSGGPVTDQDGRLVGILFASDAGEKFTLGVTIDRIRKVFGSKLSPRVPTPNPYHFKDRP